MSLGNCGIERLGSHAALSAPHVMSNVHDIRLRMCNAILRVRKFSDCVQHIQLKKMRLTIEVVSEVLPSPPLQSVFDPLGMK